MIARAKRTILHVVGYAARGGCETNCAVFIKQASDFEHTILVLGARGPMSSSWEEMGASVRHLDALRSGWWIFFDRVKAELRGETFAGAVVWAGIRFPLVLAVLARLGCPVVLHAGNPFAGRWRVRLLLQAGGCILPRPRNLAVIACSEQVAGSYRRAPYYHHLRVESCLNPVEAPRANPHRGRALAPEDPIRLGMVARLDEIKDHPTLIRAFSLIRRVRPRAELHLAGEGPRRPALEKLVDELGLAGAVRFHGLVEDVRGFLEKLDLFCFITTTREGMGNALAEAMAHGLPCVVNDLPVMHEVAGGPAGCAARFVATDPERISRAIDELLGDQGERCRLSEAAWLRSSHAFAPARVVGHYLAAMEIHP